MNIQKITTSNLPTKKMAAWIGRNFCEAEFMVVRPINLCNFGKASVRATSHSKTWRKGIRATLRRRHKPPVARFRPLKIGYVWYITSNQNNIQVCSFPYSLNTIWYSPLSKAVSYAIWHPDISRTHVTVARGIHFSNMGHSAPRSVQEEDDASKMQKRLELLPEEAIYLIERGSMFCWKKTDLEFGEMPGLSDVSGTPMTVQQAFSEMIGKEDLTIEKFQVRRIYSFQSFQMLKLNTGLRVSQTIGLRCHKNWSPG